MRKILKTIILGIIVAAFGSGMLIGTTNSMTASAQESNVPNWFRGVAGFWAEEKISDSEFVDALEFLIGQAIIKVPSVPVQSKMILTCLEGFCNINMVTIAELEKEIAMITKTLDSSTPALSQIRVDLDDEIAKMKGDFSRSRMNTSSILDRLNNEIAELQEIVSLSLRGAGLEEQSTEVSSEQPESKERLLDFAMHDGVASASQILAELEAAIDSLTKTLDSSLSNTSQKVADLEKEIAVTKETQEVAMRVYMKLGSIQGEATD